MGGGGAKLKVVKTMQTEFGPYLRGPPPTGATGLGSREKRKYQPADEHHRHSHLQCTHPHLQRLVFRWFP